MTTFAPTLLLGLLLSTPAPAKTFPAFSLENFDGRELGSRSLEGKTTIVVPTYAKCIFACPMITFFLTQLDEEIGSPADVQFFHISVQPTEDTEAEIREHFEEHGIDSDTDPRWLFANGPEKDVLDLLDELGIEVTRTRVAEGVLIEHTLRVYVIGPEGTVLAEFDSYFWDEKEMHHALRYANGK